jgi:AraC-like DNA-binding protein
MVAPDVPDYSLVVRLGACGRGPAVHTDALASDSANREALFETAVNTLSLMLGHVRAVPAHGPGARAATHDLSLRQKRMVLGVCRCVHEQYGDCHLGLRRLALEADVSVSHLCALFTHGVGIPFRSYLRLWRLHKARAWLLEDRLEIKEIAFRAGFSDPNRLRLEFKADTGMAPRVWRETCRCTPASWTAAP